MFWIARQRTSEFSSNHEACGAIPVTLELLSLPLSVDLLHRNQQMKLPSIALLHYSVGNMAKSANQRCHSLLALPGTSNTRRNCGESTGERWCSFYVLLCYSAADRWLIDNLVHIKNLHFNLHNDQNCTTEFNGIPI